MERLFDITSTTFVRKLHIKMCGAANMNLSFYDRNACFAMSREVPIRLPLFLQEHARGQCMEGAGRVLLNTDGEQYREKLE